MPELHTNMNNKQCYDYRYSAGFRLQFLPTTDAVANALPLAGNDPSPPPALLLPSAGHTRVSPHRASPEGYLARHGYFSDSPKHTNTP